MASEADIARARSKPPARDPGIDNALKSAPPQNVRGPAVTVELRWPVGFVALDGLFGLDADSAARA